MCVNPIPPSIFFFSLSGVEFQQAQVSVNESVGSVDLVLYRDDDNPETTVDIVFMTLEEFSQRNSSGVGGCRATLWDIGVGNLTADYDQAEGWCTSYGKLLTASR